MGIASIGRMSLNTSKVNFIRWFLWKYSSGWKKGMMVLRI
jgi:uncharacterized protein YpiB (UPF0302 family)